MTFSQSLLYGLAAVGSVALGQFASTSTLQQYLAPLECVNDTIVDGMNVQQILSPDDCYELLNPTPPISTPVDTSPLQPLAPTKTRYPLLSTIPGLNPEASISLSKPLVKTEFPFVTDYASRDDGWSIWPIILVALGLIGIVLVALDDRTARGTRKQRS